MAFFLHLLFPYTQKDPVKQQAKIVYLVPQKVLWLLRQYHNFLQIQFRRKEIYQDPYETSDRDDRRLHHPQQPLARQEVQAPGQEGHGPRHLRKRKHSQSATLRKKIRERKKHQKRLNSCRFFSKNLPSFFFL